MEFTLSHRFSFGRAVAFLWSGYTVVWQLLLYWGYGPEYQNLGRMIYFSVKPLVLAALIAQGFVWPRILVGVLGTLEGIACILLGFLLADEPAGFVATCGAMGYVALSLLVFYSRHLDEASRQGARSRSQGALRSVPMGSIKPRR